MCIIIIKYYYYFIALFTHTASDNLLKLLHYLKNNEVFKEYVTSEVDKFVTGWARRCREGRYEDLSDVVMYEHDGFDSDGLDLWQRQRGSKAENFHQKMHVAAGPFGIGVEMSHYLHVILAYKYLVSAGINRCGQPDFGHDDLHLEDRIQTRILEIWGVLLFSNRINVSQFKPLEFVSWGLGPLTFDPRYVEKGPPARHLKGDLRFMAERMEVIYPPIPPSTPKELGIIKEFCQNHPGQKMVDIQNLCVKFKQLTDGVSVFPKIPSMIKPSIKKWKANEAIKLLQMQVKDSYSEIFDRFMSQKASLPSPKAPPNSQSRKRAHENSAITQTDAALSVLEPPHVPPMSAPSQSHPVATSFANKNDEQCAWWPVCQLGARTCGGSEKSHCNVYGVNGSKRSQAPTDSELALAYRTETWEERSKKKMCPWFCGPSLYCGGKNRNSCEKFGENGTDIDNRPSEEELERMQKQRRKQQMAERRSKAKASRSQNN